LRVKLSVDEDCKALAWFAGYTSDEKEVRKLWNGRYRKKQ
jgi:hypothetical protein